MHRKNHSVDTGFGTCLQFEGSTENTMKIFMPIIVKFLLQEHSLEYSCKQSRN